MRLLVEHSWPGNVRELENAIERALVLSAGPTIDAEHLADVVHGPRTSPVSPAPSDDADLSIKRRTEQLERDLIRRALDHTRGNRTRAARLLDLSHRALLYKIREYGLGQ
jgi:two-component system response regulator AtoC